MKSSTMTGAWLAWLTLLAASTPRLGAADEPPRAFIDGTGPGWKTLGEADFTRANGDVDSWVWKGADVHGTGLPRGSPPIEEDVCEFRDGRSLAAPEIRWKQWFLSSGPPRRRFRV